VAGVTLAFAVAARTAEVLESDSSRRARRSMGFPFAGRS
jgi:hypothetical protein